jgi:DnaJ-class molecular chaperone
MFGKEGVDGNFGFGPGSRQGSGQGMPNMDGFHFSFNGRRDGPHGPHGMRGINPEDIFRNFFGTSNVFDIDDDFVPMHQQQTKFRNREQHLQKGEDCNKDITCSLEELYNGAVKKFRITRKIYKNHRIISETETLEVKIMPGYKEGTKLTFPHKADQLPNKLPGDVIFTVKQEKHNIFRRIGNDLHMTCDITLKEAIMGFTRSLRVFDGELVSFQVNSLNKSSDTHVIKNKGMPIRKNGKQIGYGNLVVDFEIDLMKGL